MIHIRSSADPGATVIRSAGAPSAESPRQLLTQVSNRVRSTADTSDFSLTLQRTTHVQIQLIQIISNLAETRDTRTNCVF